MLDAPTLPQPTHDGGMRSESLHTLLAETPRPDVASPPPPPLAAAVALDPPRPWSPQAGKSPHLLESSQH